MEFPLSKFRVFILKGGSLKEALDFTRRLGVSDDSIHVLQKVGVGDVRTIKNDAGVRGRDAKAYLFGSLTVEAQNAMLKILEEPPEGTFFVFFGDCSLLETVVSRAQIVNMKSFSVEDFPHDSLVCYLCGKLDEWRVMNREDLGDRLGNLSLSVALRGKPEEAMVLMRGARIIKSLNLNRRLFLVSLIVRLRRLEEGEV